MLFIHLLGADTMSASEKWATSGITTLLGLGMTFVVLALLIGLIWLMRLVLQKLEKISPELKKKINGLLRKEEKVAPLLATPEKVVEPIAEEKPISEDTMKAIETAVMGFVKKGNNIVKIKSVVRAGEKKEETPSVQSDSIPEVAPQKEAVSGKGAVLKAPMPGTVLKIKASNGSQVKKDDVIFVLEAMKMENDIVAPASGTFQAKVAEGAKVNTGDILAEIL